MSKVSSMVMMQRNRVRDRLVGQLLAIHREHAGAALAGAGAVVFEVEDERVLAGLERAAKEVLADIPPTPPSQRKRSRSSRL